MRVLSRQKRLRRTLLTGVGVAALALLPRGATAGSDDVPTPEPLADVDVTHAIENEMIGDRAVPYDRIDVATQRGIVTLTGQVRNILARERAREIAESIKGVRSVVNRIEVEPALRPDHEIERDVRSALLVDPAADSYEVDVSVSGAEATLTGTVDSWQEREVAMRVARGVRGVRSVVNEIDVDFDPERLDSEIAADVEKRLRWDVRIDHGLIDVSVDQGAVSLTGYVGSAAERTRARTAAWVAGTRSVDAEGLEVRWWAEDDTRLGDRTVRPDDQIAQAVRDALLYDPRVLAFQPDVSVRNGEVTLSGVVDNAEARRVAEEDARNTVGVWRVRNLLKVRPEDPDLMTTDLMTDVRSALERDPYLDRHPIDVVADEGRIALEGSVDFAFEKERASRVVGRVDGVAIVDNQLVVDHDWTWRSDLEIRRDIEDELFWSPFVDEDEVTVLVENGVATLEGTVDDWSEVYAAIQNARDGGARDVQNRLDVRAMPPQS